MSEDIRFNIKRFMEHAVWTPTWISNGHFAAKKEFVQLGIHLTSNDAIICAYPKAKNIVEWADEKIAEVLSAFAGLRIEFTRSPWRHRNAALFLDDSGNAAWFDADYCDALRIESLYGPSAMFAKAGTAVAVPYFSAPTFADASVVIMPMRVPVNWDQVARTVAAATSLEEATAERFGNMPEPEPTNDERADTPPPSDGSQMALGAKVAGAVMDQLENPNSDASKKMRPKKGAGSVTISSGSRSVTLSADDSH